MKPIVGSIVALVTPFQEDGSVDYEELKRLIDWHIAEGTDGIVVVGTTGESPTVDFDEHHLLIKTAVEHGNRRVPIIAGTGANSTRVSLKPSLAGMPARSAAETSPASTNAAANMSNWTVAKKAKSMLARPRRMAPWIVFEVVVMM